MTDHEGAAEPTPSGVEESVRKWLGKTGYPLQMMVAREMRRWMPEELTATGVYEGVEWFDDDRGTFREVDVAIHCSGKTTESQISLELLIAIECKAVDHPWVVFSDQPQPRKGLAYANLANVTMVRRHGLAMADIRECRRAIASLHFPLGKSDAIRGSSIVQAHTERKNESNPAYKALLQALDSGNAALAEYGYEDEQPDYTAALPVVITSAPLVLAHMSGDDLRVTEIDSAHLSLHVDRNKRGTSQSVFVVQERYLTSLAQQFAAISQQLEDSWPDER